MKPKPNTTAAPIRAIPQFFIHLLRHSTRMKSKAAEAGLWSIWLSGLMLVGLSLYATHKLPSAKDRIKSPSLNRKVSTDRAGPSIAIFAAPEPFAGSAGAAQRVAIRSWLGLPSRVSVVLFSRHESVVAFAAELGPRVLVEPNIDFTFLGIPFFHSMVARSQGFASDICVFVHPKTILLTNFVSALNFVHELDCDWFLFASPHNLSYFPFYLDKDGKHWLREDGKRVKMKELQEVITQNSPPNNNEGRLIMAWNRGDFPLHTGTLPPFLYGKGIHNHWVINEVASSELRFVLDASWSISSFYMTDPTPRSNKCGGWSGDPSIEERSWECAGNSLLGALYGSSLFHEAKHSSLVKLLRCNGTYLFADTSDNIVHIFGNAKAFGLLERRILHFWRKKKLAACARDVNSSHGVFNWSLKDQLKPSVGLDYPFTLESLLSIIADKNRTIVLGVAGFSYKDMLMSWACRLRGLKMTNFIVCALDDETYEFSVLQGLPVFRDSSAPNDTSFDDCHFGTKCFQRVTKVKSRIVLEILKLGYSVLLSDVDVYWFKDPLPLVSSFGPAVLVAQSDEFNTTGPINMPRRLNSGFYFAHSDVSTIAALEKVVKHAANSGLSEQPSFYDTLCGLGGSNRLGDNACFESETNLTVHFLDRNLFPNGAYGGLWEERDVREACLKKGCFILHNNWISGRRKKLERQVLSGLWEYDISTRRCLLSWH
ncbi:beta-arabinofuranosyltransferase RAY1 [Eucalyptus grandis]|uniref:beta-arabinofuranosyltransferase RAY1 n=1 Tax=Eucalyptus grandis TaxID=71139 RepID=UPI00192F0B4D|nr:beta-arabinofuranosyltransferase RAY1 [Eucalyptus grandis]